MAQHPDRHSSRRQTYGYDGGLLSELVENVTVSR